MKKIISVLLCLFLLQMVEAQDSIPKKRLKIGLVLSGGGAKGFAHIGVLKALEKAGIKIDYIGGTSMGAVVGGLYASGYNATQIDSIFYNTNFDELLQDYIPRSSKSFYEKRNDELYALSLPFKKLKIGIPISLSKGMYNYNLLSKLTHKVRNIKDFNKLPIPFLCVATDIEKGEPVVLQSGYLAQAMLASSAFPSLFSPVEIDGKLLIDGGVVNNYPAEEVRKMGADIIIGVDVQDDLKDRKSLKDATRILVQITNLDMIKKMKEKIKITDIYIKPDISNYGVISFDEGREIIKKGEEATMLQIEAINKLADPSQPYIIHNFKVQNDSLQIKSIDINKLDNYTRAYIIGKLQFKNDSKITYENLKTGINNINATQNFSRISYIIEEGKEGDVLRLNLTENPVKTFLKFGLHYDGLYKSAILANITQKKTLFKNDVTSLDLGLGDNIRYNFDYYIDNGFYWSFGLKSRYTSFNRNVSSDFKNGELLTQLGLNTINIDFSDLTNQAYLQTVFIQKFLSGAGI
jgi:NTE family protein